MAYFSYLNLVFKQIPHRLKIAGFFILTQLALACSDPFAVPPPEDCSIASQNAYVLEVMEKIYLWNDELNSEQIDIHAYDSPKELLADLRYAKFDRWSSIADKPARDALFNKGQSLSFGFGHKNDSSGRRRVYFVDAGSPAAQAGIRRGDEILSVNGFKTEEISEGNRWGDVFGPNEPEVYSDLQIKQLDGTVREVRLAREDFVFRTVPTTKILTQHGRKIGYLLFKSFIKPSHDELEEAFASFHHAGVSALIVDMRYNGGGLISIASQLIDLLVGGSSRHDRVAYFTEYNANLSGENGLQRLKRRSNTLDLDHIVFITTGRTLSASELVINSVRPHAKKVSIVGSSSGGKPVGSKGYDFCEQTLSPITFRLSNSTGASDYFDGLNPDCEMVDDLDHELGDANEASMNAALKLIEGKACPQPDASVDDQTKLFYHREHDEVRSLNELEQIRGSI